MPFIIFYHVLYLLVYAALLIAYFIGVLPSWLTENKQPVFCILAGGLGGSVYCLRGIYLHASIKKDWDSAYQPWYYLRPIVSLCSGLVSFIFLKAGLLALDSELHQDAHYWGFYALAFIAGLNVDKFIEKIEGVAHATWGIARSRTSDKDKDNERKE